MASLLIGPTERNADRGLQENQYARINLAQTAVLVSAGSGSIHAVTVGVAGTLAKFYDTPEGGTTDDTTQMLTVDLSVPDVKHGIDIGFSRGCTVIVTGGADITVSFIAAQTTAATRTFGT
jgi:hypothetical protein